VIVSDPERGAKSKAGRVGSGGATVLALEDLIRTHGPAGVSFEDGLSWLKSKMVLLLHSGGYASRNPNLTCKGKTFAPFVMAGDDIASPGGDFVKMMECPTVFDVKMSLLSPICKNLRAMMGPNNGGVFVAAGDVVDVFDTFDFPLGNRYQGGVIAFGHLSPFDYAELHGTFVIDQDETNFDGLMNCASFRHKYKKDELLELEKDGEKATFKDTESGVDNCIVDSDFYLPSEKVLLPLLRMLRNEKVNTAPTIENSTSSFVRGLMLNENGYGEFDVWGDLLSLCGSRSTLNRGIEDSIKNARKPIKSLLCHPELGPFTDSPPLQVYLPKRGQDSFFFHVGTMREYQRYVSTGFTDDGRCSRSTNQYGGGFLVRGSDVEFNCNMRKGGGERGIGGVTLPEADTGGGGALLNSYIRGSVDISAGAIVEYSNIITPSDIQSSIGKNSIVSQIYYTSKELPLILPANTLLVSILMWDWDRLIEGGAPVTTSCFVGLGDDIKGLKTIAGEDWAKVKAYFNGWWFGEMDIADDDEVRRKTKSNGGKPWATGADDKSAKQVTINDSYGRGDLGVQSSAFGTAFMNHFVNLAPSDSGGPISDSLFNKPIWGVYNDPESSVAFALSQLWQVKGNKRLSANYLAAAGQPLRYTSIQQALKNKSASRIGARHSPLRGSGLVKWVLNRCVAPTPFCGRDNLERDKSATDKRDFEVKLPARLILSGGWSDCCPMAVVKPGGVLNMAIKVDGDIPCQSRCASPANDGGLTFVSADMGVQCTFKTWDELYDCVLVDAGVEFGPTRNEYYDDHNGNSEASKLKLINHDNPYSIFASVVIMLFDSNYRHRLGLESDTRTSLSSVPLPSFTLTIKSLLPHGSGLGGSSILALACLRAINGYCRRRLTFDQEMDLVLGVEQIMGTGGGWQDQIGGGCWGIKHVTRCALTGNFLLKKVVLDPKTLAFFNSRLVCINTSRKRLAKRVLVNIVDSYCYSGVAVGIINELMENAERMYNAFVRLEQSSDSSEGSVERENALRAIGGELRTYKNCCVRLQGKGFLPDDIGFVIDTLDQSYCYGVNLMGAGNGGFLVGVLKEGVSKIEVIKKVEEAQRRREKSADHVENLTFSLAEVEVC